MSAVEKNALFNRMALKCQFSNVNRTRHFAYPGSDKKQEHSESAEEVPEDIFGFDNTDLDNLETFGVEKGAFLSSELCMLKLGETQQVASKVGKVAEAEEVSEVEKEGKDIDHELFPATDSDSSDMSLVIDTGSECGHSPRKRSENVSKNTRSRKKLPNDKDSSETAISTGSGNQASTQHKNKIPEHSFKSPLRVGKSVAPTVQANLLSGILQDQEKMMQSQRKSTKTTADSTSPKENPREYVQPKKDENFTYRTWNLQANEKSIRLLVRSSVDTAIVSCCNSCLLLM